MRSNVQKSSYILDKSKLCIIILLLVLLLLVYFIYNTFSKKESFESLDFKINSCVIPKTETDIDSMSLTNIPIVIISWNNYYFVKNFVNQLKRFKNRIIILDNNSSYPKLLDYFNDIKNELKEKICIIRLDKNYGHTVYLKLKNQLPDVYILSDPDLQLNPNMPDNFDQILLYISNKYKSYKVGLALDLSDSDKFIQCSNYTGGKNIYDWESQFWDQKIKDDNYELYYADVDTTFCLINNNYSGNSSNNNIRIADIFTAKHLPWYDNYIKQNISEEEIDFWKKHNKSSSLLFTCLKL